MTTTMQLELKKLRKSRAPTDTDFRTVIAKLLVAHPDADKPELRSLLKKELRRIPAAMDTLLDFAVQHVQATMMPVYSDRVARSPRATPTTSLARERKRTARVVAQELFKNILDHKTLSGKPVKKCSGAELWNFGGIFRALSKLGGGRTGKVPLDELGVTEKQAQRAVRSA